MMSQEEHDVFKHNPQKLEIVPFSNGATGQFEYEKHLFKYTS